MLLHSLIFNQKPDSSITGSDGDRQLKAVLLERAASAGPFYGLMVDKDNLKFDGGGGLE